VKGTLALCWGAYGGFYLHRHRLCLGWVAVTYVPGVEIDDLMEGYLRPSLPDELGPVVEALAAVRAAERAHDRAADARRAADLRLAEVVGQRRRDKDMAFEADFEARDLIVNAALASYTGEGEQS
jgi:hypothetical protein